MDTGTRGTDAAQPRRYRSALVCVLLAALLTACNIDPPVSKAIDFLDQAIARLSVNLDNWRQSLDELNGNIANIDDDAAKLIKTEAQQLAERTIAAVGTEFRCNVDFLGQRVLEGLNAIKSELDGSPPITVSPRLCSVSPGSVDLVLPPDRRNKIEVTGYNFDAQPRMQLILVTSAGRIDVSLHFSEQTHYKATINLGGAKPEEGIQLDTNSRVLELTWQGAAFATMPVIQRPPEPKCVPRTYNSQPVSSVVQAKHTGEGDKEIFGKGDVTIEVWRETTASVVAARVFFRVRQYDDDHSTGEATSPPIELFRAPPGTTIISVAAPEREAPDVYRDSDWEDDYIGGGGGLISQYIVKAEGPGEDLNGWAQVTAVFNSFQVAVIPSSGCTP